MQFSPTLAPYVLTQYIHHTQQTLREDASGLLINLKLIQNPELTEKILGYGADIKVLKPESLRSKIKEELERARKFYD